MYKVVINGVDVWCETPEAVLQLTERAGNSGGGIGVGHSAKVSHAPSGAMGSRWTVGRFQNFIGQLQDKQRRFLRELVASQDGLTDSALRQTLSLSSNKAFGPILTGISRRAKKVGVGLDDVLTSDKMSLQNGEKFLEFKASPAFAAVARESGGIK
jgi:hypothetical protein